MPYQYENADNVKSRYEPTGQENRNISRLGKPIALAH